ncbi:MAG: hypothetical protein GJT30_18215 [Geobacter sp.]|nr:hypothetical protein [Geobacter sp.]
MTKLLLLATAFMTLVGCTSVGNLGLVTRSTGDPGALLRNSQPYTEIGPAEGQACRFFVLAVLPFGDSSFSTAVEDALNRHNADALLNVTVSSSLYGFIPIYNVYSYTCTNVKGIAIKFEKKEEKPRNP